MTPWSGVHPTRYRFRYSWVVEAPYDDVFEVLADLEHYPQWWPSVRRVAGIDENTARAQLRSRLPYTLVCTLTRLRQDRAAGVLQVEIGGDLVGHARWTLRATGTSTTAVYDQCVTTTTTLMRVLAPLAHPMFRLNHRWMMADGQAGLRRRLDRRGGPPAQ